ncbi:hypothetical protein LguiA_034338 [Lonicera macranthoides]
MRLPLRFRAAVFCFQVSHPRLIILAFEVLHIYCFVLHNLRPIDFASPLKTHLLQSKPFTPATHSTKKNPPLPAPESPTPKLPQSQSHALPAAPAPPATLAPESESPEPPPPALEILETEIAAQEENPRGSGQENDVKKYDNGGPINKNALISFKNHVAYAIWNREDLNEWDVEGVQSRVRASGLIQLVYNTYHYIDYVTVQAFIERWQQKTNTFHLPFREMTITLDASDKYWMCQLRVIVRYLLREQKNTTKSSDKHGLEVVRYD